jgi:menaquinone-dependent protoporphyrinogen oxidase
MKILVTTASKHGATAEIGDAIAGKLREHDLEVEVHEPGDVTSLDEYDAVILGSAIYAGRWMDTARRFSERHHQALRQLPVWLFSSGPIGDPPQPEEEPADGRRLLGELEAREHRVFAGRVNNADLGWVERTITKMVKAADGDFRDFDAIRTWAAEIADEMAPATAPR